MPQHDYDIANAAGAPFRADINVALGAIATNNSGATAPATTFAFMWWADTTAGLLKQRNAANSAWITVADLATWGLASVQAQTATAFTTAGTSTAYTLTPTPAITAYTAGQSFFVNFNAASGATPTLAISGIATPPNLVKQITAGTYQNIAAGEIPASHRSRVTLLSVSQALVETMPPAAAAGVQILTISTPSLAANAMTIPATAFTLDFRSATLTSAAIATVTGTPTALVVPPGATLGAVSAVQSDIYLIALNNAGTIEYAVVNAAGGVDLSEAGVISTTAISAGATSASVVYSTTARTGVAYRVIGLLRSTQTTAGSWAQALALLQGVGGQALAAMSSLGYGQTWQDLTASRALSTTYYNTTGKPITVHVHGTLSSSAGHLVMTTNGQAYRGSYNAGGGGTAEITITIPPGGTYSLAPNVGTFSVTANGWLELR